MRISHTWILGAVLAGVGCGGTRGPVTFDGGGPDGPAPTHQGYVELQSYTATAAGNTVQGGTASAGFSGMADECAIQTQGECEIQTCNASTTTPASAGNVTIVGAAMSVTLIPQMDKTYATFMSDQPLFAGGESVTFGADGADVPAFSVPLTMPSKATITSPAEPAAGSLLPVHLAQGLSVSWTGGGSGEIQIFVFGGTGNRERVMCRYAASAGTALVPPDALTTLPPGSGGFAIGAVATAEHDAGDWAVTVDGYYNAVWPDDSIVSGGATLQ